jgi:VanZ family protein
VIEARTWRLATAACAAGVFVVSVIPIPPNTAPGQLDKLIHLCEYLLLAWLLAHVFRLQNHPRKLWAAWWWASGYGLALEFIQAFVPWRSADFMDALTNGLGAAIGVFAARWIKF